MSVWTRQNSCARKVNAEDPPAPPLHTCATAETIVGASSGEKPAIHPRENSKPHTALPQSCSRTAFPAKKRTKANDSTPPVSLADSQTQTEAGVDMRNEDCSQSTPAEDEEAILSSDAAATTAVEVVFWCDSIEDDGHMCEICYEVMARPHALRPCGHVFCEACLRELQAATARIGGARNQRGRGQAGNGGGGVLVLCPKCRAPIEKCEPQEELDATIQSKYPQKYKERKNVLGETSKDMCSRLPSNTETQSAYRTLPGIGRVPLPARLVQQEAQNRPRFQVWLRRGKSLAWGATVGTLMIVLLIYYAYFVTVVGLCKVCLRAIGRRGVVLTPELGDGPVGVVSLRAMSFAMFVTSIALWLTLSWREVLPLTVLVQGIAATGYWWDGNVFKTIDRVITFSFGPR